MNRALVLLVTISFIGLGVGNSQSFEIPSFVDPNPGDEFFASPEVTSFHKYNFLPVNLYTGKVEVSVPIFAIKVGKINVPINIAYNSGGIKVDDIASSVGLGWSLNATGSVTRVIRDLDDTKLRWSNYTIPDDTGDNAGSTEHKTLAVGYHRTNSTYEHAPIGSVSTANPNNADKTDSSPDTYMVNAPGLSSEFYLRDTNPGVVNSDYMARSFEPVFLDNSGIASNLLQRSVIPNSVIGFTGEEDGNPGQSLAVDPSFYTELEDFDSFSFTDTRGLTYSFSSKNIIETRQLPVKISSILSSYNTRITTWNLDSIVDSSSGRTVQFNYETYQRTVPEKVHNFIGRKGVPSSANSGNGCYYEHLNYDGSASSGFEEIYGNEILTKHPTLKRLTSISWDGGTVEFIYGLNREDAIGEKALTEIVVKNPANVEVKRFILDYSYFMSKEGCTDDECKRLKLDRVRQDAPNLTDITHQFEYEYSNPLPRRNSLQKDYLGFYNNNGNNYNLDNYYAQAPSPKLYFHPDQGIHSILPFPKRNTSNYKETSGDYSIISNDYALSGLLKKVTYPTGGFSEFEYERHQFQFDGEEYKAGGARIKRQRLHDGKGKGRILEYEYLETNGKSSGYVNNFPVYGYPNTSDILLTYEGTKWSSAFTTFDKARSGLELTHGNFVGYSRIIEKEVGNGYTEYIFTSPKDFPNGQEQRTESPSVGCDDFLINNSAYPGLNYVDNNTRQGRLLFKKIYDEQSNLLKETENEYTHNNFETLGLSYNVRVTEEPPGLNPAQQYFEMAITSQINTERYLMTKSTTREELNGGTLTIIQESVYDPLLPFLKEIINTDSKGDIYHTKYTYMSDMDTQGSSILQGLENENRLGELLEIENLKGNTSLEKRKIDYAIFPSGLILPSMVSTSKESGVLENRKEYTIYGDFGNLLEFKESDSDLHVSIIWGHDHLYPIAQIENATYAEISSALGITETALKNYNETNMSSVESLRNLLTKAMVTTYTYDPLVGLLSKTDARDYTTTYVYDEFNRLKEVRDEDGNLISDYQYNYQN